MAYRTGQIHIDKLAARTIQTLRSLHIAVAEDGSAHCLDLDLRAPTLKELQRACIARLGQLGPDEILPAAADEYWFHLVEMRMDRHYWLPFTLPGGALVGVTTLKERDA